MLLAFEWCQFVCKLFCGGVEILYTILGAILKAPTKYLPKCLDTVILFVVGLKVCAQNMPYFVKIFEIVEVLDEAPPWIWALLRLRYFTNHVLEGLLAKHACKTFVNWIKLRCIIFIDLISSPISERMLKVFDPLQRIRGSAWHGFRRTSFLVLFGWIGNHCPKHTCMRRSLISWYLVCIVDSNYLTMANAHSLSSWTGRLCGLSRS